jgi:hypothetical protein
MRVGRPGFPASRAVQLRLVFDNLHHVPVRIFAFPGDFVLPAALPPAFVADHFDAAL